MTDPQIWGIAPGYHDYSGQWHEAPPSTIEAILAAMRAERSEMARGVVLDDPAGYGDDESLWVVRPDDGRALPEGGWTLETEDGGSEAVDGHLPPGLPLGYHRLVRHDGHSLRLIVSPGRCPLDENLSVWGWAVQLYAARSRESWGMGDLADLRRLARWAVSQGASMALLNPIHANIPGGEQPSPYYPSSRCFRNPIYLRPEELPGAGEVDLTDLISAGRALNGERRIDREQVRKLKLAAAERVWDRFRASGTDAAFEKFREAGGEALSGFATHCVLSEHVDGIWPQWPEEYRHPDSPAVARFAAEHTERIRFHEWLQWCVDRQLGAAGAVGLDLMQDLAIGTDPAGADAWLWQEAMCLGMRVGAPPDEFNTRGQDWGLPPFDPWRLRALAYEPFVRTVRGGMKGGGALRFDHVMGLFRLFWVPSGTSPAEGTYVQYRWDELLDILALEAHRAGAYVVGEDLGTVEDFMREELAERNVLSYRLLWFEPRPPAEYPRRALAAVTTHDLPTIAGLWSGADLEEQRRLGLEPNEEGTRQMRDRFAQLVGAEGDEPAAEIVPAAYGALAQAPSMVLTATLDDAMAVEERPNVPGTVDERPNWSIALPRPIEELEGHPTAAAIAEALSRRGRT
jgi:4-alpha-glucanotransferase